MSSKGIQIVALVSAVVLTGWSHARLPLETRADRGEEFVPAPYVVETASLGFDAILADYYWLQAVQIVGAQEAVDEPLADHISRVVDVVTTLNPYVGHPYRFAAIWMTHTREQVVDANRLLERAIRHQPDVWLNHFYLGFNHFYYLGNFEEAAAALEQATKIEGSPAYLPRLVARLKSQTGDLEVAEVFLRQLMEGTDDEDALAKYAAGLDEIEIEHKARHLDRSREAFRQLVGRDIESVEELVRGTHRVIEVLPNPEPDAMPASLSRGSVWELEGDRIVSTYVGARYEVHYSHIDGTSGAVFDDPSTAEADPADSSLEGEGA